MLFKLFLLVATLRVQSQAQSLSQLRNNLIESKYDFGGAIHASLLFYEAQRSGILPPTNRIPWRGNSFLKDGQDNGQDLEGGYFDAGDYVKFGFAMASSITVLAWGAIDFAGGYKKAGELDNLRDAIKWGTDYFLKAHTAPNELWGQVGHGDTDHKTWARPEDWPTDKIRPSYKITSSAPGSDLAGETAAALAASSIALRGWNDTYAAICLRHAKVLYNFADKYRGIYSDSIQDAKLYYPSSSYGDELAWAAAWLYRATNDTKYLIDAENHYNNFDLWRGGSFSWSEKSTGVQVLLARLTNRSSYFKTVRSNCDYFVYKVPRTPKGLLVLKGWEWGSLRAASNVAFVCLQAANLGINPKAYKQFGLEQMNYILGDGGRSYVVGFGDNPPVRPHHRASSCPSPPEVCNWKTYSSTKPNPHVLIGALVGGPWKNDDYEDRRNDFVRNEVSTDYNAGFQGSLAALLHFNLDD